ncbi:hypothetical protein K466DRAFT_159732 [Polyporus arcularius HHB13444]|uniref:Uncharacterized protein n=1 Tax=Polyporus arcularius HHB13444 TaxID=1314778 RepID=A0A5C3PJS1_9APHY|nr:hypothetical protein K466DRAFT_159732 [Polyporus arcularius HHB13444]
MVTFIIDHTTILGVPHASFLSLIQHISDTAEVAMLASSPHVHNSVHKRRTSARRLMRVGSSHPAHVRRAEPSNTMQVYANVG